MRKLIPLLTLYGILMIPGKAAGQIPVGQMTIPDKGQLRILVRSDNANVKNEWFPAIGSSTARPLPLVRLRIYVRLLPDGSVQVETPKKLYNWTGD